MRRKSGIGAKIITEHTKNARNLESRANCCNQQLSGRQVFPNNKAYADLFELRPETNVGKC